MADEEQQQQRHQQQHHHHHRRHPAEVEMESVVIGKSGYHDDDDAAPMELTEEYDAMFNFKPDTGAVSIDGVRAICIFVMFFKSFTQRMTKLSNPVTNAFGYDWISSAFYFAQGARTAFNVSKLNKDLKTMSPEDAKLTRAENYVRTLFSNFMVFVWASILVITEVSHERFSMWDVLHTVIIFDTCAYPLARFVPLWMTLPFIPIILLISPYM